jgi:hypothetical protein
MMLLLSSLAMSQLRDMAPSPGPYCCPAVLPPCQVFPTDALSSSLGEGAAAAHLRSKEALLALLHERVMDKVGVRMMFPYNCSRCNNPSRACIH